MQKSLRSRSLRCAAAIGLVAAGIGGTTAHAGEVEASSLDLTLIAEGVGSAETLAGLTLELYIDSGGGTPGAEVLDSGVISCTSDDPFSGVAYTEQLTTCDDIDPDDYIIGVDGIPAGYEVEIDCLSDGPPEAIDDADAQVSVFPGGSAECDIYVIQPADLGVAIFSESYDTSILDGLTLEAFTVPGGAQVLAESDCRTESGFDANINLAYRLIECDMEQGDYILGLDGLPESLLPASDIPGFCDGGQPNEALDEVSFSFSIVDEITECDVYLRPPPDVFVDLDIVGGPHLPDAAIEIFDDLGALAATVTDPTATLCTAPENETIEPVTDCGVVALPPGTYELGVQLPDYGYIFDGPVTCTPFNRPGILEALPDGDGEFEHGARAGGEGPEQFSLCTIPLLYVTQTVTADIVVTNDSGGTSDGSDFTIEVYDNTNALMASGPDPEPGSGNASAEFELPIGEYTFGVSAPDGYDVSVVVTPVIVSNDAEIIDDPSAEFTTDSETSASAVLTADDVTAATTTTAGPTTTDVGAGVATTTTIVLVLPDTGATDNTTSLALLALGFLIAGGGALAFARRR